MDKLFLILIPLTTASTQAFKDLVPTKFQPLMALVIGIILSCLYFLIGAAVLTLWEAILAGIIIGLSAAGLFDHTKILK